MVNRIKYIETNETSPYKNLALEAYLLNHVGENECILYLWQNEKTVVIGRNQNPWKECRVKELEADGGRVVRRLSGGGAVFHDLGNLNFTFLVAKDNYSVDKQLDVIVKATDNLGIPTVKSGRNDITVEGRKFSGNAFYSDGLHNYHHGTILINVDMDRLSSYLNVSRDKLVSKGVDSVRSRVANLTQFRKDLDIAAMKAELIKAFGEVYGLQPEPMAMEEIAKAELKGLEDKFSSWDFIFGRKLEFSDSFGRRFPWGEVELQLVVDAGVIKQCTVYSDSLEIGLFERLKERLTGCTYTSSAMVNALEGITISSESAGMLKDITDLIKEEGIS